MPNSQDDIVTDARDPIKGEKIESAHLGLD